MSSSATTKTADTTTTRVVPLAAAVPASGEVHDPAPDPAMMVDEADVSYGKAVAIGSVAGILLFTVAMWLAVKALAPEWSAGAAAAIAVWSGIWSGLFLGGTIAVGRWSMKQGHCSPTRQLGA